MRIASLSNWIVASLLLLLFGVGELVLAWSWQGRAFFLAAVVAYAVLLVFLVWLVEHNQQAVGTVAAQGLAWEQGPAHMLVTPGLPAPAALAPTYRWLVGKGDVPVTGLAPPWWPWRWIVDFGSDAYITHFRQTLQKLPHDTLLVGSSRGTAVLLRIMSRLTAEEKRKVRGLILLMGPPLDPRVVVRHILGRWFGWLAAVFNWTLVPLLSEPATPLLLEEMDHEDWPPVLVVLSSDDAIMPSHTILPVVQNKGWRTLVLDSAPHTILVGDTKDKVAIARVAKEVFDTKRHGHE
jgi:hypothetical protein